MAKFTFDGPNKLIIGSYSLASGAAAIDVQLDLYSDWKEWSLLDTNSRFLQAFSSIGGEEIGPGIYVGSYFFLENGWKIRPIENSHRLIINGNLYTRDGTSPFVGTLGSYNVLIEARNSSLSQAVDGGASGGGSTAADIWTYDISGISDPNAAGKKVNDTLKKKAFLALK